MAEYNDYDRVNWGNNPSGGTALNASNLNQMDAAIRDLANSKADRLDDYTRTRFYEYDNTLELAENNTWREFGYGIAFNVPPSGVVTALFTGMVTFYSRAGQHIYVSPFIRRPNDEGGGIVRGAAMRRAGNVRNMARYIPVTSVTPPLGPFTLHAHAVFDLTAYNTGVRLVMTQGWRTLGGGASVSHRRVSLHVS